MPSLNEILSWIIFAVFGATFIIYTFNRWWRTWMGIAYWSTWATIVFVIIHFILEDGDPLKQNEGRENFALALVAIAGTGMLAATIYKSFFWKPEHDIARNERRAIRAERRAARHA